MASGLSAVFVLALCVLLAPCVSADDDCKGYNSAITGSYHASQKCYYPEFCCGTCNDRYCCTTPSSKFSEDAQDDCGQYGGVVCRLEWYQVVFAPIPMIIIIIIVIICVLVFICCCCCRCCCLYKKCRKRRPVINSTTHTTATLPQQYPQQQVATPGQPAGYQYPPYQDTPMQPGYGPQPMPPELWTSGHSTPPPYTPGPPPTYEEATCPAYPPNPMPYSQAAFSPSQTPYPLQPPAQPQFNAPPSQTDSFTQPAYNPDYVGPQHKIG